MRVRIQSDPVGPQFGHLGQGAVERLRGLLRQAVDQIDVDRLEPDPAGSLHERKHLLSGLRPVHRLLHRRVEILHAETEPVEAEFGQRVQALLVHGPGVDLDRILTTGGEREAASQHAHELAQLDVAEKGRTAPAQMQLRDHLAQTHVRGVEIDLATQVAQVLRATFMVLGDDLVAGAVVAQRLTERNVHIQRQRHGRSEPLSPLFECLDVVGRTESLDEAVGSRIGRVTRPWHVITAQQLGSNGTHEYFLLEDYDYAVARA